MEVDPTLLLCGIAGALSSAVVCLVGSWLDQPIRTLRRRGVPLGLYNQGNTCFLNAVVESLSASYHFTDWLCSTSSESKPFLEELNRLCESINSSESGYFDVESAEGLLAVLENRGWIVRNFAEQDCDELLSVFSTTLEEELTEALPKLVPSLCQIKDFETNCVAESELAQLACDRFRTVSGNGSQISLPPYSTVLSALTTCRHCHYKYIRTERQTALHLPIPDTLPSAKATLAACFDQYFAVELCQMRCERCYQDGGGPGEGAERQKFARKLSISKLPRTLVLHLLRTRWHPIAGVPVKDDRTVLFPEWLDIGDYTICRNMPMTSGFVPAKGETTSNTRTPSASSSVVTTYENLLRFVYRLSAVIVHEGFGSGSGGHFVTYRRGIRGGPTANAWFRISDTRVSRVSGLEEVLKQEAYLLFYDRCSMLDGLKLNGCVTTAGNGTVPVAADIDCLDR